MSVLGESILAIFAAVGVFTLLHMIYELFMMRVYRMHGTAELTLYGDGNDAASEQLIRIALRMRKQYLPGLSITFVEIGLGGTDNVAKHMAAREDIMYLE